jgi:hypothetical protein
MSSLRTYKDIVSQVYTLTLLASQGKTSETAVQFDRFLETLRIALEDKDQENQDQDNGPHLEIVRNRRPSIQNERIVVVKDDTLKNIVLRGPVGTQRGPVGTQRGPDPFEPVKEDEDLDKDQYQEQTLYEESEPEAEPDHEANDEPDSEEQEQEQEQEQEEEDVEEFEYNGKRYYLAPESKRVFVYIDENTPGDQVGKLMNGNLVSK